MQQINFYRALAKPSPYDLTDRHAKKWMTILILLLLFISIIQLAYFATQKIYVWYYENRGQNIPGEMQALTDASPTVKKIVQLTEKLKKEERELIAQNQLLKRIATDNYNAAFVLSDDFRAIATATPDKVWLTQLSFANRGAAITLKGLSTNAAQLLVFMSALEQQDCYRAYSWSLVTEPTPSAGLAFTVMTKSP